jgi:CDGSH-type Zn-finger protein
VGELWTQACLGFEASARAEVIAGDLHGYLTSYVSDIQESSKTKPWVMITPYQDGPYLVRGSFVLQDQDGNEIALDRRTIALCRCGRSRTRPFCDGTHHVTNFRAPSAADEWPAPAPPP